jgi:drug/metabolite transporter (DMT)-like permease
MPATARDAKALNLSLLLLLGLLWGMTYGLNKVALATVPPLTLVTARVCLAAAALWIVVLVSGTRGPTHRHAVVPIFIQGGLACAVPYTLIAFGQQSVDSALAAILNSMAPLFVCLIGLARAKSEPLTLSRGLGVALGLGGVVMIMGAGALAGLGKTAVGQIAIVIATLSSAVGVLYGRRLSGMAPELAAAGTLTSAALALVPLWMWIEMPLNVSPSWSSLAALVVNALLATALGYVIYFRLLGSVGSVATASVGYLKPTFGVLIGCMLLAEPLTWQVAVGLAATLIGVAAISRTPLPKLVEAPNRAA